MTEVFDAADAAPIGIAALAHKAPDDWAALRFAFHPSVRVLSLAWNAPLSEDEAPAHAAAFLRAWIEGGLITAVA